MSQPETENTEDRLVLWVRATPSGEHDEQTLSFVRRARTRLEVSGGELLASSGGAMGASFDAMELPDVIELAQGIVTDALSEAPGLEVSCAIAHGMLVLAASGQVSGAAIDRAQQLAHHSDAGEIALDEVAAQQAEPMYLFRRELTTHNLMGRVLDPLFDKRGCREALELLRTAPWPRARESSYARLCGQLRVSSCRVVLAASAPHISFDRVMRARAEIGPPLVLHATREASGLAPLGGISVALRRAWGLISSLALDEETRVVVKRLHQGASVRRGQAAKALASVLRAVAQRGSQRKVMPWIVLERVREIDGPSLLVISDVLDDATAPCSLLATIDESANIPSAIARVRSVERVVLDPLDESARVQAAAAALSLDENDPLAHRVAELGGDSVLGIDAAAHALVSVGDVVHDGQRFRFRTVDRRPVGSAPIDELVLARISGLSNVAQRVLEACCVSPIASPATFTSAVAELDGLPADAVAAGRAQLASEGLLLEDESLGPLEATVRQAVRSSMPPARAAELHRFVAHLMRAQCPPEPSFQHAIVAHHLAEGGNDTGAASALLDAAYAASSKGFDRVAVRLAALALKLDGSGDARDRASRVAAAVESNPLRDAARGAAVEDEAAQRATHAAAPSTPPRALTDPAALAPEGMASDSVKNALRAILARDTEAAETALDTAIASGLGRSAAMRLWSLAQLAKGDVAEAVRALRRAGTATASGKQALTAALILLEADYVIDAVRSALDALAITRRLGEARGEQAALLVLSGCYRRLGRSNEALMLETRAGASAVAVEAHPR